MIGWKEQEPETKLSIKHLELSVSHYFKACCNLFWYGLKPALLISQTLVNSCLKTCLSLTAMFQNDGGRFSNITNRKLFYTVVTTILQVVHQRGYYTEHFYVFNIEVS